MSASQTLTPKVILPVLELKLWRSIFQLPDIAQKCFCIQNKAMNINIESYIFQMFTKFSSYVLYPSCSTSTKDWSYRTIGRKNAETSEQRDLAAQKTDDARNARAEVRTLNHHFNISNEYRLKSSKGRKRRWTEKLTGQ